MPLKSRVAANPKKTTVEDSAAVTVAAAVAARAMVADAMKTIHRAGGAIETRAESRTKKRNKGIRICL